MQNYDTKIFTTPLQTGKHLGLRLWNDENALEFSKFLTLNLQYAALKFSQTHFWSTLLIAIKIFYTVFQAISIIII